MAVNKSKRPNPMKPTQMKRNASDMEQNLPPISDSLLDVMIDGKEFESLVSYRYSPQMNLVQELRRCIGEIEAIRHRPVVCYIADVLKAKRYISIDHTDDLPFREMINNIPREIKEIDIVLVTPGGNADQVNSFVSVLRPRFDKVNFILLDVAMSAGTIFIMSGDEIIMSEQSKFGPIDPQVPNRSGRYVPAQSLLITLKDIQMRGEDKIKKGEQPDWTDIQLLRQIDPYEIGSAKIASQYSIEMVTNYLSFFKFSSWTRHADGREVTEQEKETRASEIAQLLCDHSIWKNHGYTIDRDMARDICRLKITHSETIDGLDRVLRRMWAVVFWIFESTNFSKFLLSDEYCITRRDA